MPARLIIDLRCLQDPNYAERGIGGHARAIVTRAPGPFIGIIDPKLPPLQDEIAALPAEFLSPEAAFAPGSAFLNPAPMIPDQNYIAPLLLNVAITKAACVFDFIPLVNRGAYLAATIPKLDYYASLAWLKRYDMFFPISEDTGARLQNLYGPVRAHVTGAALPAWAENNVSAPPRHILMVGGEDARKNPEVLIAAHAASDILRHIPLVITGDYSETSIARLQALGPVLMPGRLSDAGLRRAYAQALALVAPSRAEGFSLPVIEAMAARTPAIVSDIPAHRALIPEIGARFAPDDAVRLASILEDIVENPRRRSALVAAQQDGWRSFTGDAIASKIWGALAPMQTRREALPHPATLLPVSAAA